MLRAGPAVAAGADVAALTAQQQQDDDLLDIDDVIGKRIIDTRLHRNVTIREENAIAALEVMSRFAANPKWLIYLPPTMSPSETTQARRTARTSGRGVRVLPRATACARSCARKSTWARARSSSSAGTRTPRAQRFGYRRRRHGIVLHAHRPAVLQRRSDSKRELLATRSATRSTQRASGTSCRRDWVCLDCELMPWSAKAQELLRQQYAAVGAAARAALRRARCSVAARRLGESELDVR